MGSKTKYRIRVHNAGDRGLNEGSGSRDGGERTNTIHVTRREVDRVQNNLGVCPSEEFIS